MYETMDESQSCSAVSMVFPRSFVCTAQVSVTSVSQTGYQPHENLPLILAKMYEKDTPEYDAILPMEERLASSRSVIVVDIHKVGKVRGVVTIQTNEY